MRIEMEKNWRQENASCGEERAVHVELHEKQELRDGGRLFYR